MHLSPFPDTDSIRTELLKRMRKIVPGLLEICAHILLLPPSEIVYNNEIRGSYATKTVKVRSLGSYLCFLFVVTDGIT